MVPVVFFVLILLTGGTSSESVCSYQDVVDYLNLTTDNSLFKLTRPVLDHTHQTTVQLDILLYAILAVQWNNEFISWDPAQFCGITQILIPKEMLWRPDIFIYEMVQKDDSPRNPFMQLSHDGTVMSEEGMNVISTCKMDIHKFPFDTQSCNITIGSAVYSSNEIRLFPSSNSSRATQFSREVMQTQGEWVFLHLSITRANFTLNDRLWEQLIYTVQAP
nr:PREDICTED: 5-hydroxytryptamine receptor 3E-like [Paralichthys olivaceus]